MKKSDVVSMIFHNKAVTEPRQEKGLAFAPTNIALCKYWGKRDADINLPITSSLSVSLPDKGALTSVEAHDQNHDVVILNGKELAPDSGFVTRLCDYLNLFREDSQWHFKIDIKMNIPVAAGLASSACGFASLVSALRELFEWRITQRDLSILARLGSGSASRSLWTGFVEWHAGAQADGMDSYAEPLKYEWPGLHVGILVLADNEKSISSRQAMQHTVDTSILYANWPKKVAHDISLIKNALHARNFSLLGGTSESNALAMHATMLSSWPPVCYFLPETIAMMHKIWELRKQGLEVYFTEDAGPNLKLLFHDKDKEAVKEHFPQIDIVQLFE